MLPLNRTQFRIDPISALIRDCDECGAAETGRPGSTSRLLQFVHPRSSAFPAETDCAVFEWPQPGAADRARSSRPSEKLFHMALAFRCLDVCANVTGRRPIGTEANWCAISSVSARTSPNQDTGSNRSTRALRSSGLWLDHRCDGLFFALPRGQPKKLQKRLVVQEIAAGKGDILIEFNLHVRRSKRLR